LNKHEIGKQRIKDIIGDKADDLIKMFEEVSPDFAKYVIEFGYGDIYARPNFSDKYRELAAVACLIGQGNTGVPLKAHINGMLNVGWSKQEIVELFILLIGYVGFPSCVDAILLLKQVLEENTKTGILK
jgi:4-carboxymuconolactone decarboxylase